MTPLPVTREDIGRAMHMSIGQVRGVAMGKERVTALRRAAVLCPIIERPHGLSVILTRRAENLRAHPGQISFPGGKIDADDRSPLQAALREAEEEIGLVARHVDVAGVLEPYSTGTGFLVTPFVGFVDPRFRAVADPSEVAEVFEAPLDFLMDHRNHVRESYQREGKTHAFYVIHFERHRIWGATAGMLRTLANRLAGLADDSTESIA